MFLDNIEHDVSQLQFEDNLQKLPIPGIRLDFWWSAKASATAMTQLLDAITSCI